MSENLYETLCVVRTSLLNAVGSKYIEGGKPLNITRILDNIASEMEHILNFMDGIYDLSEEELLDLGFDYLKKEDSNFMLFPIWLYPFIPEGEILLDNKGGEVIMHVDTVEIWGDHWINAGFHKK